MRTIRETIYLMDIDGVLADYAEGITRLYNNLMSANLSSRDMVLFPLKRNFPMNEEKYKWMKDIYRNSDFKLSLKEIRGFRTFRQLKRNATVWLWTSRPTENFPNNKRNTLKWLDMNRINYEQIIFVNDFGSRDKFEFFEEKISPYDAREKMIVIDDDPNFVNQINGKVYKTILFNQPYNMEQKVDQKIKRINNLADL